jgi:hypothetical protein
MKFEQTRSPRVRQPSDPHSKVRLTRGRKAALALASVAGLLGVNASRAQAAEMPSNVFLIGTYLQPYYTMAGWQADGINTMVGYSTGNGNQALWDSTAANLGLYTIRAPSANPADDINDTSLIAWSQPDEPDANNIPISTLVATYNNLKQVDPSMPVYLNFSGFDVLYPPAGFTQSYYQAASQAGDWISSDLYPVTGFGRPDWIDLAETGPWNPGPTKWTAGVVADTLANYTNGKPQYVYIETSNQGLYGVPNERGPTADEVRGEVWDAIIHNARGIVYFPFTFSGRPDCFAGLGHQQRVADRCPAADPQRRSHSRRLLARIQWNGVLLRAQSVPHAGVGPDHFPSRRERTPRPGRLQRRSQRDPRQQWPVHR